MPYKVNLTPPRPGHVAVRKIPKGWIVISEVRDSRFMESFRYQVRGYHVYGFKTLHTTHRVARRLVPAVRAHQAAEHDHAEACS